MLRESNPPLRRAWRTLLAAIVAVPLAAFAHPPQVADSAFVGPRAPAPFDEARIAPAFPDGPLLQARELFHQAKYEEAHALFAAHDDGSPQAAYLRALAALETGREGEAARLLADLPARLPVIADRIHWHLALAREAGSDIEGAAKAYGAIREGSVLGDEARLAHGHALRKLKRWEEAARVLAPLAARPAPAWGNDLPASALLLMGLLHDELGNPEEARAAYLKLWAEHPSAPEAEDAKIRAQAKAGALPLAVEVSRAKHLIDRHRNREGADLIRAREAKLKLPDPLACDAHLYLGRALRKMRHHTEARGVLGPVADACDDEETKARALYLLATSTSIVAPAEGAEVWRRLAAELPHHSYADDALFHAAEIDRRAGDREGAREGLRSLIARYPEGDFRKEALFKLFWMERQGKTQKEGLQALRTLEEEEAGTVDGQRAVYWQGRVLAELGRTVEAVAAWKALVSQDPASYYAMLARGRLMEFDEAWVEEIERAVSEGGEEVALDASALEGDRHFEAALALLQLGFRSQASDELLRIDRAAARERAGGEPTPSLLIAFLLDAAESRRAAHHIARTELASYLRGRPVGLNRLRYQVAFPLAYRDLIETNTDRYGVPADLMQALMREESGLDPDVVSWAGAVGLTQLMPSTARAEARRLGLGAVTTARLRDPAFNVRIGTAYLGSLLKRWNGSHALATASYNAGPGAVSRWLRERGDMELDEFVEEIPIDQTRNYVKRVLGSYSAYRLIYGEGSGRHPAILPAKASPR